MMNIMPGNNMQLKSAKIISSVFHPLFTPLYGLLIIFTAPTLFWYLPFKVKEILFFIMLINNVLIPVSLIPFFRYRNILTSRMSENSRERVLPLLTVSVVYTITSYILFRLQIPGFIKAYSSSLAILAIVLLIINLWWKISLYSAGAGSLAALVLVLSLKMSSGLPVFLALSVLASGLILASRLKLSAHNPAEVYAGFLCGFGIPGFLMLIFQ